MYNSFSDSFYQFGYSSMLGKPFEPALPMGFGFFPAGNLVPLLVCCNFVENCAIADLV